MDDKKFELEENTLVEFKTTFKGYSIPEVNEYIAAQRAELEDIRSENAELYRKIDKLTRRIEKLKAEEAERNKQLDSTKAEADRIIREAKKQAAQELLRAGRQRSRMVAEMTEQVDEQKRLYQATKIEAAKFRCTLFALYRDHIELINAMSEASGAFDEDSTSGITEEDLKNMEKLLETEEESEYEAVDQSAFTSDGQALLVEAFSDTASITIPPSSKAKGKKEDKKKKKEKIEEYVKNFEEEASEKTEEGPVISREDAIFGEASMYSEFERGETAEDEPEEPVSAEEAVSKTAGEEVLEAMGNDEILQTEEDFAGEEGEEDFDDDEYETAEETGDGFPMDPAFVITEEDMDEFTNPDGREMEYDGPVSVDSVFKKNTLEDDDFEKLYGDTATTDEVPESFEEISAPAEEAKTRIKNGYGFKVNMEKRADPEDDSNEFYMESDAEFDPAATDGVPTGTVGAFGVTSKAPSTERRWRVRKSKSLTDEFDVIKAEEE